MVRIFTASTETDRAALDDLEQNWATAVRVDRGMGGVSVSFRRHFVGCVAEIIAYQDGRGLCIVWDISPGRGAPMGDHIRGRAKTLAIAHEAVLAAIARLASPPETSDTNPEDDWVVDFLLELVALAECEAESHNAIG